MQFLAVTNHGLALLLKIELEEKFGIDAKVESESKVSFKADYTQAIKVLRFSQGLYRVCLLISKERIEGTSTETKGEIVDWISSLNLEEFMKPDQEFAVRAHRSGSHEFRSVDIAAWVGEAVISYFEQRGHRPKVNLTTPQILFRVYVIQEIFWFSLDMTGTFAVERNYRKFNHPAGLRSQLGFFSVLFSGWKSNEGLLFDPTTGSGTIPIEAALFDSRVPVSDHHWDDFLFHNWMDFPKAERLRDQGNQKNHQIAIGQDKSSKFLEYARVHSKIAGVSSNIVFQQRNFLKVPLIPKNVTHLVFNPPFGVRMGKKEFIAQLYSAIYSTSMEYGVDTITHFATKRNLAKNLAESHGYTSVEEFKFNYGGITVYLMKFFS